jgi:hypothetical protein
MQSCNKITKTHFCAIALDNGLAMLGLTKRPLSEVVDWASNEPKYNGMRDAITMNTDNVLVRHSTRDGQPRQSTLRLDKYDTCYLCVNGMLIVHSQYPAEPGMAAWEQSIVYG